MKIQELTAELKSLVGRHVYYFSPLSGEIRTGEIVAVSMGELFLSPEYWIKDAGCTSEKVKYVFDTWDEAYAALQARQARNEKLAMGIRPCDGS